MNRSTGTTVPNRWTVFCGRMPGSGCCVMPKASSIAACATSSTPSEATSLASGEELRIGRYTTNSVTTPTTATNSRLSTRQAQVGRVAIVPVLSDQ